MSSTKQPLTRTQQTLPPSPEHPLVANAPTPPPEVLQGLRRTPSQLTLRLRLPSAHPTRTRRGPHGLGPLHIALRAARRAAGGARPRRAAPRSAARPAPAAAGADAGPGGSADGRRGGGGGARAARSRARRRCYGGRLRCPQGCLPW